MSLLRIFTIGFLVLGQAIAGDNSCTSAKCYQALQRVTPYDVMTEGCRIRQHVEIEPCTVTTTTTITEFTETSTITSTTSKPDPHQDVASSCPYTSRTTNFLPKYATKSCNEAEYVAACVCLGFTSHTNTDTTPTVTITHSAGAHTTTTSTTTTLIITSCPPSSTTFTLSNLQPTTITTTTTSIKTSLATSTATVSKTVTSKYPGISTVTAGRSTSVVTATTVPTVYKTATLTATSTLTSTSTVTTVTSIYISSETTLQVTTTYMQPSVTPNTCYIQEFYVFELSTSTDTQTVKSTISTTKTSTKSMTSTSSLYTAKTTTTIPLVTSTSFVTPSIHTQTNFVTKSVNATTTTTSTITNVSQYESFATDTVPPCEQQEFCINGRLFNTLCQIGALWYSNEPSFELYRNVSDYRVCLDHCANNQQCGTYDWNSTTGDCTVWNSLDGPDYEGSEFVHDVVGDFIGSNCTN